MCPDQVLRASRLYSRSPDNLAVTVRFEAHVLTESGASPCIKCRGIDVSLSGIRLVSEKQLPADSILRMAVEDFQTGQSFHHKGTVRWSDSSGNSERFTSGIEFTHTDAVTLEAWRRFTMSRLWPTAGWDDDPGSATHYLGA